MYFYHIYISLQSFHNKGNGGERSELHDFDFAKAKYFTENFWYKSVHKRF